MYRQDRGGNDTDVLPAVGDLNGHDDSASVASVRDLYKAFGSFQVMRGLSLDFKPKAVTTILGPSGTGKSVLLKHMVGLLEPDAGTVKIFGQDIWGIPERQRAELRKRFGVLFQDGALFGSMNVYDNVAFPLRKHTDMAESEIREVVKERLKEVGLEAAETKAPNEISGGMKKRAGFARALVMNPEIVLFDEPDSGLDPVRTSLLNDVILKVHAEDRGTYVVVTHDIRTARKVSDYVGLIWQGQVVYYGAADEAFASEDPFVRQFLAGDSVGPLGMD
jgi:phospholipid/cholesterol/gamma-HCH transport system ATP-binding protein